ncbi:MAG: outer membrane beta-barrel protein [Bacteroidia bacterium]
MHYKAPDLRYLIMKMNIRIWLTLIVLSCTLNGFAQDEPADPEMEALLTESPNRNFKLGVRGGIAFSTFNPAVFSNPAFAFGITGGATARWKFGKIKDAERENYRFGFEAQANFIYRGSTFDNLNGQYNRISLFYIDLPLLGIMKLDKKGRVKLLGGIQGSYLANSSIFIKPDPYKTDTIDLKLKPFSLSAVGGVEYRTDVVGIQFFIKQGITDINKGMNATTYPNLFPTLRNGSIKNFTCELTFSF